MSFKFSGLLSQVLRTTLAEVALYKRKLLIWRYYQHVDFHFRVINGHSSLMENMKELSSTFRFTLFCIRDLDFQSPGIKQGRI